LALLARHTSAVAIHGCSGDQPEVLLGGLDSALANEFAVALRRDGINVRATGHDFPGTRPLNICNRTASQAGVQFELTMSCREGAQRARFVAAVRRVLLERELAA
jgi:phage replication-related protein YjqB (UPF0714/DUF867 family)